MNRQEVIFKLLHGIFNIVLAVVFAIIGYVATTINLKLQEVGLFFIIICCIVILILVGLLIAIANKIIKNTKE